MALPTLPLAILDACGTTRSIARAVDGNATPPKSLDTLGDTAFGSGAAPHAMSDFEGFSSGNEATVCTYYNVGQYSANARKCGCIIYNPALGASQTYYLCTDWNLYAYAASGERMCACFRIVCNTITKASCLLVNNGVGTCCCTTRYGFGPIDNNDNVCYIVCTVGVTGAPPSPIIGRAQLCMHLIYNNVNGTVTIGTPNCIAACSQVF